MELIKIDKESKLGKELVNELKDFDTGEEQIVFLKDNEEVGRTELPSFSTSKSRIILAEIAGVKDYDNFQFINKDGQVYGDGDSILNGKRIAEIESNMYKERLANKEKD